MIRAVLGAVLTATVILQVVQTAPAAAEDGYPAAPVTMTAGANPGSGFDLTIRSVVDALQAEQIVDVALPVENRPGASGADFLATMVEQYRGRDDQVSVTSLSMMINQIRGVSAYGYTDVTMIARLMTDYFVVVTRPDSEFTNLNDVLTAIKSDPARVAVGAANDDHAPFDLLVSAAGGDPCSVNYVTFEGGGDQADALSNGDIDIAVAGVSEFVDGVNSGAVTALGVLSEERLPGLAAPTAREQGFDVTLSNWRGLYGPPDMPEYAVTYWQQALDRMVSSPTWNRNAAQHQFTTTFMVGQDFQDFLARTQADLGAGPVC